MYTPPPPTVPPLLTLLSPSTRRIGFGGYSGAQSLTSQAYDDPAGAVEVDDDLARVMARLVKHNTATRLKALADLVDVCEGRACGDASAASTPYARSPEELAAALPQWTLAYRRLHLDNSTAVRVAAAKAMGIVAGGAGKGLGKHLKRLAPSWWFAQHDPDEAVARAARSAFDQVFSTDAKRANALLFAHAEIFGQALENLTIKSPGDMPHKEGSADEQAERHERLLASTVASMGGFAKTAFVGLDSVSDEKAVGARNVLGESLDDSGCLGPFVRSPAPVLRRAAYVALMDLISAPVADELLGGVGREGRREKIAQLCVSTALEETESSNFSAVWELCVSYPQARPECWSDVDATEAVIPALKAHLASGCHGNAIASAPSILPFLSLLPPRALTATAPANSETGASALADVLAAAWEGWRVCCTPSRSDDAAALLRCQREGLLYGLIVLAPGAEDPNAFRAGLVRASVLDRWAPGCMARADGDTERRALCEVLATISAKPELGVAAGEMWSALAARAIDLARGGSSGGKFDAAGASRVVAFHRCLVAAAVDREAKTGEGGDWVCERFAAPVAASACESIASDPSDAAAADVAAAMVRAHGSKCLPDGDASGLLDKAESPALLAAVVSAAPGLWDDALSSLAGKAGVLADVLSRLSLNDEPERWSGQKLDDAVVNAADGNDGNDAGTGSLLITAAPFVSPDAAVAVMTRLAATVRRGDAGGPGTRDAAAAWAWPPPVGDSADAKAVWEDLFEALFCEHLASCESHEDEIGADAYASSSEEEEDDNDGSSSSGGEDGSEDGSGEDDVDSQPRSSVGGASQAWEALERSVASNPADLGQSSIHRRLAAAAAGYLSGDRGAKAAAVSHSAVSALVALGAESSEAGRLVASAAWEMESVEGAADTLPMYLAGIAELVGWEPVMDAADVKPDRPFEFADRIMSVPAVTSSFETFLMTADERQSSGRSIALDGTLARLAAVATSRDKESADAALVHVERLLRKVRRRRSDWLKDGEGLFRVWFDAANDEGSTRATASVLPLLLPPRDSRDASHAKFVAAAVADATAMIARRNSVLSGPPLLIAAACFSEPHESGAHAGSIAALRPVVVKKGEASELLDLFRKLSQREAAEAVAAAAAARFGDAAAGAGGPMQTPEEAEEAELGVAALSLAAIENCAADMDARDWQTIIGRLESWTQTRVLHAETTAETTASIATNVRHEEPGGDQPSRIVEDTRAPEGWKIAAVAARILIRIDALPVTVATPDPSKSGDRGDIVAYSVKGPDAGVVARQLASADWPTARGGIHASLARIALAAGAQLHCCDRVRDEDAALGGSMTGAWWRARSAEAPLWNYLATLWSSSSGQSAVAATDAWREMDDWEDAGCGTIPSLYALMLSSNDQRTFAGVDEDIAESLTRASYALLSTPALLKPAVIGLDANIDDVALIEEAMDKAEDEGDLPDGEEPDAESEDAVCEPVAPKSRNLVQLAADAAEKAAMREQLAEALAPDPADSTGPGGRGSPAPKRFVETSPVAEGTLLCWSLLLRLTTRLPPGSRTRERLLEYARATKAVPRLMSAISTTLPLAGAKQTRVTRRGSLTPVSRRGSLTPLADTRTDSPGRGGDANVTALPAAWRELGQLARDAAASGGTGGGKAAAGAAVDPLEPGLLYRRAGLSGTSDGDDEVGNDARVSSRRAAREAHERKSARLAVGLYHAALRALPAAVRVWFADLRDKGFAGALASATAACVSPALLAAEFDAVERASEGNYGAGGLDDDAGELTIKASRGNREVIARYDIDDACLELVVRLPASYPLAAAELDCAKRVGISEARLRKWMLTVSSILQHQNGAVAEGLMLWRSNIDREFKGVEPCPICYLVIHGTNHQTPRLVCRQCSNKFHSACLYKWFQSSSGSKCPLCQVPWGSNYR